jgi:hypothetical protein
MIWRYKIVSKQTNKITINKIIIIKRQMVIKIQYSVKYAH